VSDSQTSGEEAGKAYYVTTPIYYVNDAPHIGHAYATVAADVLSRWHRQRGERVWFLTGTDEHGEKVMRSAEANGDDPQHWVDRLVTDAWLPVLDQLEVANDDFIRTTEDRHARRVQAFLQHLYDKGEIYEGSYSGPYCVGCEEFKLPGDLELDDDGVQICPIHSRPVETVSETNWFFRLSAYTQPLLDHYRAHPEAVEPSSARNEVLNFVESGLTDLSISRSSFTWGIPIPWDTSQVTYVWFDALLNYATAVGYGESDPDLERQFAATWPADVHLVGKDILRFHAVIWPAMLMAAGLPLPGKVFAHGWLLVGGEKMSKSKLTGIAPHQITDHFGADAFRYYFLSAIPFGHDASFSWEHMSAVYTSELANGLGNLASRVAAMVGKYFDGTLPAPTAEGDAERALAAVLATSATEADAAMLDLRFHDGLLAVRTFVEAVNGYVTEQQPWKVAKDDEQRERLATILYAAADSLRALAVLYAPVMPTTAQRIWDLLGAEPALGPLAGQRVQDAGRWGVLPAGCTVTKGAVLFPRLEDPDGADDGAAGKA
jgi:methionyl-tRNA synthetase